MSRHTLFIILLTISLTACKKHDACPEDEFYIKGVTNSDVWKDDNSSAVYLKSQDQFYIHGHKAEEWLQLGFHLSDYQTDQKVDTLGAALNFLLGGDVIVNSYEVVDSVEKNQLTITRIDTLYEVIEGRFTVNL